MSDEQSGIQEPLSRVEELVDLRVGGTVTIEELAVLVKDLSTEDLIDLSSCIVDLSRR
jgi:hypothetical protein